MNKKQIRWTISVGSNGSGQTLLNRWKKAALKAMYNNPKLFNVWIRNVLNVESAKILKRK